MNRPGNTTQQPKVALNLNFTNNPENGKRLAAQGGNNFSLPPDIMVVLKKHEQQFFEWMRKDEKHPYLFANDPLKALQQAVPGIDLAIIKRIEIFRRNQRSPNVKMPDINLHQLTVRVK